MNVKEAINSFGEIVGKSLEEIPIKEKFEHICKIIGKTLGIERVCIFKILNEAESTIMTGVAEEGPPHKLDKIHLIKNCPPIVEVIKTEEMVQINNPHEDKRTSYLDGLIETIDMKSILFVPVIMKDEVAFIIVLDAIKDKMKFTEEEELFITTIAANIAELRKHDQVVKHKDRMDIIAMMFGTLTHELRNKLTALIGITILAFKQTLKKYPEDDELKTNISIIQQDSSAIERLIEYMSQSLNEKSDLDISSSDLTLLIKNVIASKKTKKYLIQFENGDELPDVMIDNKKVEFALKSILSALRHHGIVNNGGDKNKITEIKIALCKNRKSVKIKISGPKIKNIAELFEANEKECTGAGFNSVFAKTLIESHTGASFEAKPKKDSSGVAITFPIPSTPS